MPRRVAPVFPVRPNKSTTTVSAVASPGRAVRPYKTRYYCNTGRLIESFPRRPAFCGAVALYASARQLQKAATPRTCAPNGLSFFPLFLPSFFLFFSPSPRSQASRVFAFYRCVRARARMNARQFRTAIRDFRHYHWAPRGIISSVGGRAR